VEGRDREVGGGRAERRQGGDCTMFSIFGRPGRRAREATTSHLRTDRGWWTVAETQGEEYAIP